MRSPLKRWWPMISRAFLQRAVRPWSAVATLLSSTRKIHLRSKIVKTKAGMASKMATLFQPSRGTQAPMWSLGSLFSPLHRAIYMKCNDDSWRTHSRGWPRSNKRKNSSRQSWTSLRATCLPRRYSLVPTTTPQSTSCQSSGLRWALSRARRLISGMRTRGRSNWPEKTFRTTLSTALFQKSS